jgi:hypothetical protein
VLALLRTGRQAGRQGKVIDSEGGKEGTRGGIERAVEEEVFPGFCFWLTAASAHEPSSSWASRCIAA